MKVLVLDNYDSFTYNIVHLIYRVCGTMPDVIFNDDPDWRINDLEQYDAVVVSPGPGSAENCADFGHCRDVILRATVPVLGICLGHQGIAYLHGGAITRAPIPVHGVQDTIVNNQNSACVLRNIPKYFKAVRYHSLVVESVPHTIEVTARTRCGLIMALRHRTYPLWGVQFHPESICSEYGELLLTNFISSARFFTQLKKAYKPPRSEVAPQQCRTKNIGYSDVKRNVTQYRMTTRRFDTKVNTFELYNTLFGDSKRAYWLDSSLQTQRSGRYSFMGDDRGPESRLISYDANTNELTISSKQRASKTTRINSFFDWLKESLKLHVLVSNDISIPFCGGWVGYLGYELKQECGVSNSHKSTTPDAQVLFSDRFLVYDHQEEVVIAIALNRCDSESMYVGTGQTDEAWFAAVSGTLKMIRTGTHDRSIAAVTPVDPVNIGACAIPKKFESLNFKLRHSPDRYLQKIDESKNFIESGDSYELCLTNMAYAELPDTNDKNKRLLSTYQSLRATSPAPYAAYLVNDDLAILSSSPERFLKVTDKKISSCPIKGTRPRGKTKVQDFQLKYELVNNIKDRAENLMIVDLVRNDIGHCSQPDSVRVTDLFKVESYSTVHQLVSEVCGELAENTESVECVRAAYPGGSMTGAPKVRSMQILDNLEQGARGIYSGSIGYFSLCGNVDLNIVIRSLVVERQSVSFGTGGAIVWMSDKQDEFDEILHKAAGLLRSTQSSLSEQPFTTDNKNNSTIERMVQKERV